MGYVSDFIKRLSNASLYIEIFPYPELGHAALEAMCVGVPVAKFTEDPKLEEIINGFNGILAASDEEMVEKLTRYVLNMNEMRDYLSANAKNTIVKRRNPKYVAVMWKTIIDGLILHRK